MFHLGPTANFINGLVRKKNEKNNQDNSFELKNSDSL